MDESSLTLWVALSLIPHLGGNAITRLLDHFGTLAAILAAPEAELLTVPGIGPKRAAAIRGVDLDRTRQDMDKWRAAGIAIVPRDETARDPAFDPVGDGTGDYPAALRDLPDAPPVLFRRGTITAADTRAVAVVGARQPQLAARRLAHAIAHELAARGWTIVSGLAAGIDTAAHEGALAADGPTLAVLGSGITVMYPPENRRLAARIQAHGALLSEVHPAANPNAGALVARNRLISGLSRAVIVVEAGERSGSLHAARFGREQGRTIYAVSGDAPGNRALIGSGAHALDPAFDDWDRLAVALDAL